MSKDYYRVKDGIGRIWEVDKSVVRADYIQAIAALDNKSFDEVADTLDENEDLDYWWKEQIRDDFEFVSAWGRLVKDISPAQKKAVLRDVAMQYPTTEVEDD